MIVASIFLLIQLILHSEGATTFFNYGSEANNTIAGGDDDCTEIDLNFSFNYYGNVYTSCCISINGFISFVSITSGISPSGSYYIAPFSHDLSTKFKGKIYYRLIKNSQTLNQIGLEISSLYYLNTVNFVPTNALIVTWDAVPYYSLSSPANNFASFQLIISTDSSSSFLTINYGSLGFDASDGYRFKYGSSKTTITSTNPEFLSNVGVNGKRIYHLTQTPDVITTTSTRTTSTSTTRSTTSTTTTTTSTSTTTTTSTTTSTTTTSTTTTSTTTTTTTTTTTRTTIPSTTTSSTSTNTTTTTSISTSSNITNTTSTTATSPTTLAKQVTSSNGSFQILDLSLNQLLDIFSTNIDTNNCLVNCSRNGFCSFSQIDKKFFCTCNQFYAGQTCSIDTRPCSSNPCFNEGKCIQNLTYPNEFSYHCDCGLLYEGNLCEYKIDVCKNETCSGNGNCVDFNNKPKCVCFSSYEGDSCETMSESLKTTKKIISTASIIAICVLVCFYLIVILSDLHRIFFIKRNTVSIKNYYWNKKDAGEDDNFYDNEKRKLKGNTNKRSRAYASYLDYIE